MLKSPPDNCEISLPNESNINEWEITITGPESTPYAGGKFVLTFSFPAEYPFKPPSILYKTRIYHPNIKSDTGEICAAILYDEWGPTLNVRHCLSTMIDMLKAPNADSPLEEEIARSLREKPKEFEKKAKQWTKEHAM
jgi:ubiquitin-protein ligase